MLTYVFDRRIIDVQYLLKGVVKMKIQVNISDDLVKRVDEYAKTMGVSRSALCAVFIGQGVMGYEKAFELSEKFLHDFQVEKNK